jgi:hypothetical protein
MPPTNGRADLLGRDHKFFFEQTPARIAAEDRHHNLEAIFDRELRLLVELCQREVAAGSLSSGRNMS